MQASRYDRQQRFDKIGVQGQQRIEAARVVIIGMGALGSVIAEQLARAGVGFIRIIDRDTVEWSNLQRQALYTEADAIAGLAKVQAAAARLLEINSEVIIEPIAADVTAENIGGFTADVDLIIDGTDNFEIRFLINDVAWDRNLPWIHGGCTGASGQVFTFIPGETICFQCLVPSVPDPSSVPTCDTAGVLGPATHTIASLQAMAAIKTIVQRDESRQQFGVCSQNENDPQTSTKGTNQNRGIDQLISVDIWAGRYRSLNTSALKNPNCPCCGLGKRDFLRGQHVSMSPVVLCGRNAVQIPANIDAKPMVLERLAATWQGLGEVSLNRFLVRLTLADQRSITLFKDGRAVIGGTEDPSEARALIARFVGN